MIGLKNSRHIQSVVKPIVTRSHTFSRASGQKHGIKSSFDWFIGLSVSFVIGESDDFSFGFASLKWKPLCQFIIVIETITNILDGIAFLNVCITTCLDFSIGNWTICLLNNIPQNRQSQKGRAMHLFLSWSRLHCCLSPSFPLCFPRRLMQPSPEHVSVSPYSVGCLQPEGMTSLMEAYWMYWKVLQASRMQTRPEEAGTRQNLALRWELRHSSY